MQPQDLLGFLNIGGYEWLIILIIALLLFGRRLPEVMRGLGGGVREFRKGLETGDGDREQLPQREAPRVETQREQTAPPQQPATGNGGAAKP